MKKTVLAFFFLGLAAMAQAQLNPITWSFTAKKIADKTYEVQCKATIMSKWHLYSQTQPEDAVAMPTTFVFSPNPLFTLEGKVKETGKMEKYTDKTLGISANLDVQIHKNAVWRLEGKLYNSQDEIFVKDNSASQSNAVVTTAFAVWF